MKRSLNALIALYVAALLLAVAGFVASFWLVIEKREFWLGSLHDLEVEGVSLAVEYRASFQDLNSKLLRYQLTRSPGDLADVRASADSLERWIEDSRETQKQPEIREALRQLSLEHQLFSRDLKRVLGDTSRSGSGSLSNSLMTTLEEDGRRVLAMEARLASIKRDSILSLLERGRNDLDGLWLLLSVLMVTMLGCVALLARFLYRDLIAPLRRTVIQSRNALERQEKLAALGLLTAGMAHEIRNPLNSIKARLYTQRRLMNEASPALEDNQFIEEEIDRLEGIVREALQFGRPSEPAFQEVRLSELLRPMVELLEPSLARSRIRLRVDLGADETVLADPGQFKQALLNLVKNAAESIGSDGQVTLRSRPATLRQGRRVVPAIALEIEDTGPGIAPAAKARLFDPFFTTKENGTGLGLSITARILHAHSGLVECESEPGRGALFRMMMPLKSKRP